MADMTKTEIEQIIKDYLSTRQIELKDFTTISGVDGTTYVLLVQPTGTANKMDVNLLKKQLVAEIKEPADVVIKEVEKAGKDAAAAITAATKAVSEANTAATSANEAANTAKNAAANVKDGKTPVFGTVTAKGGDKASATYKLNGVDANNNPKYDVAFVLEKGADGKHPVLQSGNITTLAPDEQVKASFRANGYDATGRPIYLVDLGIPKGNKGDAGDGSGNVLVNPAGLKKDARYLFVPKADGSAEGAFVKYVEPVIGGVNLVDNSNVFLTNPFAGAKLTRTDGFEVQEWGVKDATRFQTTDGTNALKFYFNGMTPKTGEVISLSIYVKNLGKKNVEIHTNQGSLSEIVKAGEARRVKLPNIAGNGVVQAQFQFRTEAIVDDIDVAVMRMQIEEGTVVTAYKLSLADQKAEIEAQITSKGYQTENDVKSAIDAVEIGGRNLLLNSGRKIKKNTYNLVSYLISEPIADGEEVTITVKGKTGEGKYPYFMAYNTFGSCKITDVAKFKDGGYYAATTKWIVGGANTHVLIYAPPSSVISESEIEWVMLTRGNKPATGWSPTPEDLTAHQDFITGSNTITTLSSIPADKRTILATLGAATNITLKEPLEVGKELLISINPTADFEQPLPVSNGWQSLDGDTLSLKAGKPAELSILCVDNYKYVLSSKVAE